MDTSLAPSGSVFGAHDADDLVALLRAAGEPTRFRILLLLAHGDLTVKDLTSILGQSQPRISRHLKLLVEAGLVARFPEGAWAYYRLGEGSAARGLVDLVQAHLQAGDRSVGRDLERLAAVRAEQAAQAQDYFATHATDWNSIRSLHVEEGVVEAAILEAVGERRIGAYLDLGTGTGRLLELLAGRYQTGVGVDLSHDMLSAARASLAARGVGHVQLRHGDIYALAQERDTFDLVTLHQVLHYLDDPARAVREAARVLRPAGLLIVIDFAPHEMEFLREDQAHRRLGFGHREIARAMEEAGLELVSVRDLPAPGDNKLTVTLWLGQDTRRLVATSAASSTPTSAHV